MPQKGRHRDRNDEWQAGEPPPDWRQTPDGRWVPPLVPRLLLFVAVAVVIAAIYQAAQTDKEALEVLVEWVVGGVEWFFQ